MKEQQRGDVVYLEAFKAGIAPDPILTVSEWADRYRVLSTKSSRESGRWRTSRTPYLREPMDALSASSPVRSVVFMKGAQIGGTEMGNNWIGYSVHHDPCPMLGVLPTVDMAKRASRQRIDPMFEDTPELRERVRPARSRDSGNTMLSKEFPGGIIVLTGANSAVGLRSMPFGKGFYDEVDAWPGDVDGEGDPEMIADRGTRTYTNSKTLKVSTPTIGGRSRIERAYQETDRRRYWVPCPDCGKKQVLVWKGVQWEQGDPSTAHYCCEHCGVLIPEYKKTEMLKGGEWIPEDPSKSNEARGYHLSSLYSPVGWFSWADCAAMFMKTKGKPAALRVFVNTVLGETYEERGEAPPWGKLYRRREAYKIGTVPAGGLFLVCGVDVQDDYIQSEVVAYGRNKESWSIDQQVFDGDTSSEEPFDALFSYLGKSFPRADGAELRILRCAIDTGYRTSHVYGMIRAQGRPGLLMAVKGREGGTQIISIPRKVDVSHGGKTLARGLKLWTVGADLAKAELYGWLRAEPPNHPEEEGYPTGFCHFPEYEEEWFKQLTAEQVVPRLVRGYRRYVWEKTRDRNEALDCRVYARAAAAAIGMDRMTESDWDELEGRSNAPKRAEKKSTTRTKRKPMGYLDRRKNRRR